MLPTGGDAAAAARLLEAAQAAEAGAMNPRAQLRW